MLKEFLFYYLLFYAGLSMFYLIWRYVFILIVEDDDYGEYKAKTTTIIPVFNEAKESIRKCIESAVKQENNEVIVVDDGSTNGIQPYIRELSELYGFKAIFFKKNKGKRHAQYAGIMASSREIIVTLDSDTILEEDAIKELIKPFNDKMVAAVTGNCCVLNEKESWLTRLQASRYYTAFNLERYYQGKLNIVTCCSGVLSAYRREYVIPILRKYMNTIFLGKKLTYGDDRHLTMMLLENYKIKYCPTAICYTNVPTTLKAYIKQQKRWKQSFLIYNFLSFRFIFKRSKALAIDTILSFSLPFLSLIARLNMYFLIFMSPILAVYYVIMIAFMAIFRNLFLFFNNRKYIIYNIGYGFLHELCIYWLIFVSLFTLRDRRWGTR